MSAPGARDHYQVLGVPPGAGSDEIRRAHRQLARVLHPDRQSDATDPERRLAERRMREVNAAWTVLSDPQRRRDYDNQLRAERTSPTGARAARSSRPGPGSSRQPTSQPGPSGQRPEDADDPDLAYARAREEEFDPDEEELTPLHFWILRRGPIIAAVVVALFLFVATAYAGGGAMREGADGGQPTTTDAGPADCVRLLEGRNAVAIPCSGENDGRIMTQVDAALECPSKTKYVLIGSDFFCVSSDPSVSSSTPTVIGD